MKREWIKFVPVNSRDGRLTKVWAVMTLDGSECLGSIGWYSPWRRYSFIVRLVGRDAQTLVFEWDCLRLIADFCQMQTKAHTDKRAAGRNQ